MSKNKYEKFYREGRDVCGAPFPEFLKFFDTYPLHLNQNGFILIADESKNKPLFHKFFDNHIENWQLSTPQKGILFAQKIA